MPSLSVIISGDANKLKAEFDKINTWSAKTGQNIKTSLNLGGAGPTHSVNSTAMREALVLVREMSRGNWTRVPGSLSILLSQLGILPRLLNPVTLGLAAIAAGFFGIIKLTDKLTEKLTGLKLPDFTPKYIAEHLQKANAILNIHKDINDAIEKMVEHYASAAESARRGEEAIRKQYDYLRKIAELSVKGPLDIAKLNAQERQALLGQKFTEMANANIAAQQKLKQAEGIVVPSESADKENLRHAEVNADAARAEKKKIQEEIDQEKADKERSGFALDLPTFTARTEARAKKLAEIEDRIKAEQVMTENAARNEQARKQRDEFAKQAAEFASEAKKISLEIPDIQKESALANARDVEEAQLKAAKEGGRREIVRGHLTENQRIGAYIGNGAGNVQIDISRKQLHVLEQMNAKLGRNGPGYGPPIGSPNH